MISMEPLNISKCNMRTSTTTEGFEPPTSPSGIQTLKEQENERQRLTKENFNLKLKLYHLEERMNKLKPGKDNMDVEDLESELLQCKLSLEEKVEEVAKINSLNVHARHIIEELQDEVEKYKAKQQIMEENIKNSLKEEDFNKLKATILGMEEKQGDLLLQITSLTDEVREKDHKLQKANSENQHLTKSEALYKYQLVDMKREYYKLQEMKNENANANDDAVKHLQKLCDQLEREKENDKEEIQSLQNSINRLTKQLNETQHKHLNVEKENQDWIKHNQINKNQLEHLKKQLSLQSNEYFQKEQNLKNEFLKREEDLKTKMDQHMIKMNDLRIQEKMTQDMEMNTHFSMMKQLKGLSIRGITFQFNDNKSFSLQFMEYINEVIDSVENLWKNRWADSENKLVTNEERMERLEKSILHVQAINVKLREKENVMLAESFRKQGLTHERNGIYSALDPDRINKYSDVHERHGKNWDFHQQQASKQQHLVNGEHFETLKDVNENLQHMNDNLQKENMDLKQHNHYLIVESKESKELLKRLGTSMEKREQGIASLCKANQRLKQKIQQRDDRLEEYRILLIGLKSNYNLKQDILRQVNDVQYNMKGHRELKSIEKDNQTSVVTYIDDVETLLHHIRSLVKDTHAFYERYTKLRTSDLRDPPIWLVEIDRHCNSLHDRNARLTVDLEEVTRKIMVILEKTTTTKDTTTIKDTHLAKTQPKLESSGTGSFYDREISLRSNMKDFRDTMDHESSLDYSHSQYGAPAVSNGLRRLQHVYGVASSTLQGLGNRSSSIRNNVNVT